MTRITAERGGGVYGFRAEGHSSASAECNYITGVLYAYAGYLLNATARGMAAVLDFKTGEASMCVVGCCIGGVRSDWELGAAWEAAYIGLLQLEKAKPEAIRIELNDKPKADNKSSKI